MDKLPKIFAFTALGLAALPPISTQALAADVGVSVSVGQPGFYGRLDIGDYPAPQVVYRRPVIIEHGYVDERREPVYLRVPPGHRRHWNRNCSRYNACGQPVYFVRDDWYNNVYAPQYRERQDGRHGHHGHRGDHHDNHDNHDNRDNGDRGDRRDDGDNRRDRR